ncbi:MAG: DMT family transporter [Cytophagales bacterium]
MNWIYVLVAAIFQILWIFNLKYLNWDNIKLLFVDFEFSKLLALLPLVGFIAFGLGNAIFYSLAIKTIAASTAFAVFIGIALIGAQLIEVFFYKEPINIWQIVFLGLIVVGILGIKMTSTA